MEGKLNCYSQSSVEYNKTVGKDLTVTIKQVTSAHTGKYACQVSGYESTSLDICELHLELDGIITCSVPIVEPLQDTILTCNFPEDLNVTKKDFSVYHYNKGVNSDTVLDCWWFGGTMECIQSPNVQYNRIVSKTLSLTIRQVTTNNTGTYACQVDGYPPSYFKTCDLQVKMAMDQKDHFWGVWLSVGVLLVAVLVIVGFILLRYTGTMKIMSMVCKIESLSSQPDYEIKPMMQNKEERKSHEIRKDRREKSKTFEEYLEKEVLNMFPNIFKKAYFVPPVYFNKTRGTPLSVADQVVNELEPPDPCDVRHDRAMQHVLNCLHYVATSGKEQMFVLTQFKYTDYLNTVPEEFKGHLLPVSSITQNHEQILSFDFLIIHRRYGVMVGVVKDCSSNVHESHPGNDTDTMKLSQVSEAIEQLKTAARFVSEVMSDKENFPKVLQVLILFNIPQPTVKRLPRDVPGINQNSSELWWLHFERLPDCMELNYGNNLKWFKQEWDTLEMESQDNFTLNKKQYLAIIGRFCGPATTSALSMEGVLYQLPKSLSHAVSLTGDMFERMFLYPKMTKLLEEPFLFLAGPPGTGKTRMLALIGRKWVLEGHPVHIISTSPGGNTAATHLHQLISSTVSSRPVNVLHLKLNLEDTTCVTRALDNINKNSREAHVIVVELNFQKRQAAKRLLSPVVKWDIDISNIPTVGNDIQRKKSVEFLFTELRRRFPNLHMWGAGCTDLDIQTKVPDLRVEFLTDCLTCPPSVLREVCERTRLSGVGKYTVNQSPVPTSGPPVKHVYHRGRGHFVEHHPQDCSLCTKDIITFLIQDLCIQDENIKIDVGKQEIQTSRPLQPVPIRYSDILIFFESDVNENTQIVKSLKAKGIPVQVISNPDQSTVVRQEKSSILMARSSLYLGYRRKVVVFVEGDTDSNDITVRWNRLRCWTCCTSQLILVHNLKT